MSRGYAADISGFERRPNDRLILVIIRQGLNLAMAGGVGISATNITYAVTGIIVVGAVLLDVLKKKNAAKVKIPVEEKKTEAPKA